jgi:undecaprenyl-diphosphatase
MSPTILQIALLAFVQGAAELLPVSSSAHVIVAEKLMGLDPSSPEMTFLLAMLHTGTMGAVVLYFWKSWRRSFFASSARFREAAFRVALATAMTAVVAYPLKVVIETVFLRGQPHAEVEQIFSNLPLMAASLAVAGTLIVLAGLRSRAPESAPAGPGELIAEPRALWMGVVQGVCIPFRGLSRSGATISAGILMGVPRRAAEEFSFALAVVITPAVIFQESIRFMRTWTAAPAGLRVGSLAMPGLIGMACSFVAGLVALRWLSGWLEKGRWVYFGFYCFAAAAGVGALACMGY